MAHTLRHFCSFSSIGTDTRCCSTPCRFVLGITLVCENRRNRPMYLRCYCPPVLGGHCDTVAMHCICETWLHSLCNLQVNLRYAHWHKFCDDGNFSSPKECRKAFGGTPEGVIVWADRRVCPYTLVKLCTLHSPHIPIKKPRKPDGLRG